jgi:hypothetical protein
MKKDDAMDPISLEAQFYLTDPEHRDLNQRIAQIKDPAKRQLVLRVINSVSGVSPAIESIRKSVVTAKK